MLTQGFHAEAQQLRTHFESRFADPRRTSGDRFCWCAGWGWLVGGCARVLCWAGPAIQARSPAPRLPPRDYWYVPGQYQLQRTPADSFFPRALYQRLEDALVQYGEAQLGCRGISPVWLRWGNVPASVEWGGDGGGLHVHQPAAQS